MKSGKFIIDKSSNDEFWFKLKASNGEIILISELYKSKQGCEIGINSVIENSKEESNFDIKTSKDNKRYFVLKADNGEIIGTSETYNSLSNTINGINSVINFANNSEICWPK